MNFKQIKEFVDLLGCDISKIDTDWVTIGCVFAPWSHKGGSDNNPSMGIKVVENGMSYYSCFACMQKGSLNLLVEDLRSKAGPGAYPYKKMLELIADSIDARGGFDCDLFAVEAKKKWVLDTYDEEWLNKFVPLYTHPYLKKRKISVDIAKELDIRFHYQSIRIGFPIRNFQGHLCGFQGRDVTGKQKQKYKFMKPSDSSFNHQVWLGEDKVDLDKPVVLTEGAFDYAKIYEVYPNVLASLGANINSKKLERLKYGSGKLITLYDADMAGDIAREIIENNFKKRLKQHIIPDVHDAGDMEKKELQKVLKHITKTFLLN